MALGVDKCVEVIDGVAELVCDIIDVVKSGGIAIPKYFEIAKGLIEIAKDLPKAFPEARELDAEEISLLVSAAWSAIEKILADVIPGEQKAAVVVAMGKASKKIEAALKAA